MLALREAWTWSRLKHKNVVPLWGIADYRDLFHGAASQLCMISPWEKLGNAEDFFKKDENERFKGPFLLDIARGLLYLHSAEPLPIIHGDLKGSNILVTTDPDGLGCRAQLSDFGLSRMALEMESNVATTSTVFNGNIRWLAWERVDPQRYGIIHGVEAMSTASDVFEMMRTFYRY